MEIKHCKIIGWQEEKRKRAAGGKRNEEELVMRNGNKENQVVGEKETKEDIGEKKR